MLTGCTEMNQCRERSAVSLYQNGTRNPRPLYQIDTAGQYLPVGPVYPGAAWAWIDSILTRGHLTRG